MSIIFRKKLASTPSQQKIMNAQWEGLKAIRGINDEGLEVNTDGAMSTLLKLTNNAGRTPADAYREFDSTTVIDKVEAGEHATLTRLLQKAKSVDLGKEVFEYRKSTTAGNAQSSMSGQVGVKLDHVDYKYGGTVVPIHDVGFGRGWREMLSAKSEGFDFVVDDSREAERTLMAKMNDYLFNGNAALSVKGNAWLGLKNDSTVEQYTITTDLSASASTPADIRDEVRAMRDVLYINNNCTQGLTMGVSREIMSNWERPFTTADGTFGTIGDYISKLRGITEVYEDSELVGNEAVLYFADQQGLHPVVGMAISTYAAKRDYHNSDFNFIKWAAVGFISKTDAADRKCALYAS